MKINKVMMCGIAAFVIISACGTVQALDVPALNGHRVNDNAGLLTKGEASSLETNLAGFEQKTTDQIAILTTKDLQGETIEEYANAVFRAWKLGQKGRDNGVLVVIAVGEKNTARIEVGYGLEGALPDAVCKDILSDVMKPLFKQKKYAECLAAATGVIERRITGEYAAPKAGTRNHAASLSPVVIVIIVLIVVLGIAAIAFMVKNALASSESEESPSADRNPIYYGTGGSRSRRNRSRSSSSDDDGSAGSSPVFSRKDDDDSSHSSSNDDNGPSFEGGGGSSGGGGASGGLD
jgi:uncharacterized protein